MSEASCDLRRLGKAYPRTCAVCGLGPCQHEPKKTITLPFSPEDVRNGTVGPTARDKAAYDRAWEIIRHNSELASARQRLSLHEFRKIIEAVAAAFAITD